MGIQISPSILSADFAQLSAEVESISALDQGEAGRTGPNPNTFDYVPD